ncbi:NADH-quinone oxidoreductase subunit N [Streptomyces zingiberis]|uniref:NADH-quinone oxidoreductase subunit N n=1 Tax=Streptomyces zingiberis TaxID=2053010 RepID=A0ABX1BZA0_9ACTN|nr:proton-conducting transporter membrane subunit [Streptomyces zingiberis]NJQ02961.1 NADH-quinone oxidoreductase subunit N [Streptomyces zingiberis]
MTSLVQSVDWLALAPPALAAGAALVVLVADLFLPERRKPLLGVLATAGLLLAGLALLPLLGGERRTFCLTTDPDTCSYVADPFALAFQFLVLGGALLTALISLHTVRDRQVPAGEYWFLLLASAAGAALLPASRDLATLVIALEVASLPVFALVGLVRDSRLSGESALKFFLSSVTATAVMLLGVSFVYAVTGALHLPRVADGLADVPPGLATLATAGVALTLVGFAFKAAAAPFHFWVPDTYIGAPVPVAGYLSVVGKAAGLAGLILVAVVAFPSHAEVWGPVVAVLAALTMTAGNAAALRQRPDRAHGAVRLLAWSSVGQAGYLLVPVAAAAYTGASGGAVGTAVAYALMYAAVNLGAFAVTALVVRARPAGRIADFRGLWAEHPLAALALAFFLLVLAGLPPGVIGLFAKAAVVSAALEAGLGWLALVTAVNVVIALVYYLRWTADLFRAPVTGTADGPADGGASATADGGADGGPATLSAVGAAAGPAESPAAGAGSATAAPRGSTKGAATGTTASGASAAPGVSAAPGGAAPLRTPVSLAAAISLAAVLGVALSGAPQLVLRFVTAALF